MWYPFREEKCRPGNRTMSVPCRSRCHQRRSHISARRPRRGAVRKLNLIMNYEGVKAKLLSNWTHDEPVASEI